MIVLFFSEKNSPSLLSFFSSSAYFFLKYGNLEGGLEIRSGKIHTRSLACWQEMRHESLSDVQTLTFTLGSVKGRVCNKIFALGYPMYILKLQLIFVNLCQIENFICSCSELHRKSLHCLGRMKYETNRKRIYFSFITVMVFVIDENLV